ncbi:transposase [Streptomyces sp. SAS_272]|uniref:transposase n=1 Tax=Streptomyces sp. SAS_272 TaxID=3412747 RepID=UPI00403D0AFA
MAQATRLTLRMLAERVEQLTGQIDELNQRLTRVVVRHARTAAARTGGHRFGQRRHAPDHHGRQPDRLSTEASLAALCGVSPIEYSSGRRSTRRLNHGGDRQANAVLHRIVFTRLRHDLRDLVAITTLSVSLEPHGAMNWDAAVSFFSVASPG